MLLNDLIVNLIAVAISSRTILIINRVNVQRSLGFRIRPPYYQGFFSNFVFCLAYVAPIWWGFEWFFEWNEIGISMLEAAYNSLQCGALFGLLMSIFYAIRRKQLNLTDWESLGE
nr:DUF6404 family protein [Vibrio sp. IB15]